MLTITDCSVLEAAPLGDGQAPKFFLLRLKAPGWTEEEWRPGQFVMVRPAAWESDLPLPRPFSICEVNKEELGLFFQVMGKGTAKLSMLRTGDIVRVLGPLGSFFAMEADRPTLMLAGGMGLAPFLGYVQKHPKPQDLSLLFGHRPALDSYPFERLRGLGRLKSYHEQKPEDLRIFLQAVDEAIQDNARRNGLVLVCGPTPFLRAVRDMGKKYGASIQISLENRMACGIGACQACVVKPLAEGGNADRPLPPVFRQGLPVPVCTCGPVFWADTVDLG
ncbi:MAG: dihydroorotate dehydrogenase electron transfer subunit [Desulfovibrionaceae bacterium]|nr:dihydroorotate dehydrogenase electron transfer subunit [Desulfovibrionaceae bacterium]